MKNATSIELSKWSKVQQTLAIEQYALDINRLSRTRLLIDNLFVCLLQAMGISLDRYLTSPSLIAIPSGVCLAILILKGNRVIPGCFLGAFLGHYLVTVAIAASLSFAFFQVLPIICFVYVAKSVIGATLIDLPFKKQLFVNAGLLMTAFFISLPIVSLSALLSVFNGLLIMSEVILTTDLYFVDWCEVDKKSWQRLIVLLLITTSIIIASVSLTMNVIVMLPLTLMLSYLVHRYFNVLGLTMMLLLYGFLQLCSTFLISFSAADIILLQSLLLLNAVFSMYLMRREFHYDDYH